jgi:hypothetical protein
VKPLSREGRVVLSMATALALAACRGESRSGASHRTSPPRQSESRSSSKGAPGRVAARESAASAPPFKTLVIEMSLEERDYRDGQEIIHRWGRGTKSMDIAGNRRRDDFHGTVTVLASASHEVESTLIFDGDSLYYVQTSNGKTVASRKHVNAANGYEPLVWKEGLLPMLESAGLRPTADSFMGRSCKVFRSRNDSEWVWDGVLLKAEAHEAETNHTVLEQAVRIQEDVDLADSQFAPPSGVVFVEDRDSMAQSLVPNKPGPWAQPFYLRTF